MLHRRCLHLRPCCALLVPRSCDDVIRWLPDARRHKHDWMRDAEREARSRLPRKGKDGISALQAHLMDSLQFEIKEEMMAQTVRLEERLKEHIAKLGPLRAQAEEGQDAALAKRYNRERSTALRLLHEYGVQREAATGQAMTHEMATAFQIPRAL